MSYRSRVYRHRNAHTPEAELQQSPFFSKQQDRSEPGKKNAFFQAKLSVNETGDSYEQEADSVAHAVVNKTSQVPAVQQKKISSIQRVTASPEEEQDKEIMEKPIQRMCAECEKEKEEKGEEGIQRMAEQEENKEEELVQPKAEGGSHTASRSLSGQIESSSGKGSPLPAQARAEMQSAFGMDFSGVTIHTDAEAVQMNKELSAQAFTHGSDIYFNAGKFNPETSGGKQLLAHELTHVVQQQEMLSPSVRRQPEKENGPEKPSKSDIISELKKNPQFKKLPKETQDEIIEQLESAPEEIVEKISDVVSDLLKVEDNLKEFSGKAVKVIIAILKGEPLDAAMELLDIEEGLKELLKVVVEEIMAKLKGEPPEFSPCDLPNFHPARTSKFKGMCCTEGIENENVCCLPSKVSIRDRRCCKKDEVVFNGSCTKSSDIPPIPVPLCPPGQKTASGECCVPPMISNGIKCVFPSPPIPVPPQPKLTIENIAVIGFNKDAPQTWFHPSSSFGASVTANGKSAFKDLVAFLKANPGLKIQLEGHASTEKPINDPDYNQKLTDRRAKLIVKELQKRGIDIAGRLQNIPDDPDTGNCSELSSGVKSCGDLQAQSAVDESDRKVTVKAFQVK